MFGSSQKSPGQKSQVRTEQLEMELDHDTGRMDGQCLKGKFAGRTLSSLTDQEVMELLDELRAGDMQEANLIEAYLDWRFPEWRDQSAEQGPETDERRERAKAAGMRTAHMRNVAKTWRIRR